MLQGPLWKTSYVLFGLMMLGLVLHATGSLAATPSNDAFANSQQLSGALPIDVLASNVGATHQSGEPGHAPLASEGHTIWFRWEAPSTEVVTVGTCGSEILPIIGVYLGESLGSLNEVAENTWDWPGCGLEQGTQATFKAIAGKSYSIQIDSNSAHEPGQSSLPGAGSIELQIRHRFSPPNDNFANAEEIPLNSHSAYSVPAPNYGATTEPGEPAHQGDPGGASVWFKFTATHTGGALVQSVGGPVGHTSLLAVYTGDAVNELTPVPLTEVWSTAFAFPVVAGETYRIAVDGKYSPTTESPFMDEPEISVSDHYPGNDDFEDAYQLAGGPMSGTWGYNGFSNVGATEQPGEPQPLVSGGVSVWFHLTAQESGSIALSACPASFHALLEIYRGSTLTGLTPVAASSNPQSSACERSLAFNVDAGTEYRLAVDGLEGQTGTFGIVMHMSTERIPSPPSSPAPISTPELRPPRTHLVRAHVNRHRRLANFRLDSSEPESTFLCKLDSHAFTPCLPSITYRYLRSGPHTFESTAVNSADERDRTPVVFHFKTGSPPSR